MSTATENKKIPFWIDVINMVVMAILLFQLLSGIINTSWAYGSFDGASEANRQVVLTLAGRNFAMLVVAATALFLQKSDFYFYTFLLHFFRELYDALMIGFLTSFSEKGMSMMAVTIIVFLVPYAHALRRLKK